MGVDRKSAMGPELLEKLQDEHCDPSRGTLKGARILRNVGEVARFFPIDEPILCVGSGDGLEVEAWKLLGYDPVYGLDISHWRCMVAQKHGVRTWVVDIAGSRLPRPLNGKRQYANVYCAHTLEHCTNPPLAIEKFSKWAFSTICIVVPVELNGSRNPSHLSPFSGLNLQIGGFGVVYSDERINDELEAVKVYKRNALV